MSMPLMRLVKQRQDPHAQALGFTVNDYLTLVDWAGRTVRANKRGAIPKNASKPKTTLSLKEFCADVNLPPARVQLDCDREAYQ